MASETASLSMQLQQGWQRRQPRAREEPSSDGSSDGQQNKHHRRWRKQRPGQQAQQAQLQTIGAPAAMVAVGMASLWCGLRGAIGAYQRLRRHCLRRLLKETAPGGCGASLPCPKT